MACLLLAAMSAAAMSMVLLLISVWPLKLGLSVLIITAAVYSVLCHGLRRLPWSIVMIEVDIKSQLKVSRYDGKTCKVKVRANTLVTPYLTVLNCQDQAATWLQRLFDQHIVIFSDAAEAQAYRRLRVFLRWTSLN